jgi:hypothetical protein
MATASLGDETLADLGRSGLSAWLPNVVALVTGRGSEVLVTQGQVDALLDYVDALREAADGDLAAAIDRERARLDVEDWVGIDMDEALRRLDRLSCEGFEEKLYCGELSGDCRILATDALLALRIAVALAAFDAAADMDASGAVLASDALAILRIAVGLLPETDSCND